MIIGKRKTGAGFPCYVIAEIGHNHQGSLKKALELIRAAADSGADAVKLQKRNNKDLFTKDFFDKPYNGINSFGRTYGQHREFLELSFEEIIQCKYLSEEMGVDFIITPFDEQSLSLCHELDLVAIKIASGDLTNIPLLVKAGELGKPIILSTGGSTLNEIETAHKTLELASAEFSLLYAVSSYPTLPNQANLNRLSELKNLFPATEIGYSGHDEGILGAMIARTLGASIIEKHFTLDKNLKGTDHSFSLTPMEFQEMRNQLKRIDDMLGTTYPSKDVLNEHERAARHKMGKSIYAADHIPTGTIITTEMICIKSPSNELSPADLGQVLGKQTRVELKKEDPLKRSFLI